MNNDLVFQILQTCLVLLVGGLVGLLVKKINEKFSPEEIEKYKQIGKIIVLAVEQIGKVSGWDGKQKFEEAKQRLIAWLAEKGKVLKEDQIKIIIEACVAEMNLQMGKLGESGTAPEVEG